MRYFFDTEFIEDGSTIDLLSIGIVDQTGERTLYLQNLDAKFQNANDWVWRNVYPHLIHFDMTGCRSCAPGSRSIASLPSPLSPCGSQSPWCPWRKHHEIRDEVRSFLAPDVHGKPEMWGYFADYDWVVFCQLFGRMVDLPKGFPFYCRDLKQLLDERGNPRFQKDDCPHHALSDAQWIRETYIALNTESTFQPKPATQNCLT